MYYVLCSQRMQVNSKTHIPSTGIFWRREEMRSWLESTELVAILVLNKLVDTGTSSSFSSNPRLKEQHRYKKLAKFFFVCRAKITRFHKLSQFTIQRVYAIGEYVLTRIDIIIPLMTQVRERVGNIPSVMGYKNIDTFFNKDTGITISVSWKVSRTYSTYRSQPHFQQFQLIGRPKYTSNKQISG